MAESLEYAFARPEDVPEAAAMIRHSFPGPARPPAWWEAQLRDPAWGGGAGALLLGREGARLVAACQIHPLRQWIAGAPMPVAGVGSVAVAPTHRRRGLAVDLVARALREARERGDVASALYPFRHAFYAKLGYGRSGTVHQYQVPPTFLSDSRDRAHVELVETDRGRSETLAFYSEWIRAQTGQLERSEKLWSALCTQPDSALIAYRGPDGRVEGYALVQYRTQPRAERRVEVDELAWSSREARRALHAWLSSLGDQWEQIVLRALPSEQLSERLIEPRLPAGAAPGWRLWVPAGTVLAGTMFRLLQPTEAWQLRGVAPDTEASVQLDIRDVQLPENAGRWVLEMADARATLSRSGSAAATIRCDIATISRVFIGAISLRDALAAELIECDRPDLLPQMDAALRIPEPWTFDRF